MNTSTTLLSAVLAALGLAASSAFAATSIEAYPSLAPAMSSHAVRLAKNGADDPIDVDEDAGCDDHGTNVCAVILAKDGADDAVDGADDNGVDLVLAKNGADDLVDGEDDHGVDFIIG